MYSYKYPRPAVTVDALVFRKNDGNSEVLLIRRGHPPYEGMWASPGGFMDMDETPKEAAVRELHEETSIKDVELVQFHTYGAVNRDPKAPLHCRCLCRVFKTQQYANKWWR